MPEPLTVTVDVDDVDAFRQAIIETATRQLLKTYVLDDDGSEYARHSEMAEQITRAVNESLREQARDAADGIVRDLLEGATMKRINAFGEGRGRELTLREFIADVVKDEVQVHLPSGSRARSDRALAAVVEAEVKAQLTKELNQAVQEAKGQLVGSVRQHAAEVLADIVAKSAP